MSYFNPSFQKKLQESIQNKQNLNNSSKQNNKPKLSDVRDLVYKFIKLKGAVLPVEVSKEIKMNTMFSGAVLSELISAGKIRVSHAKIGGSPLYYVPEQKHKLSRLYEYLNEKDKRAYDLLKKEGILNDDELTPLMRVALRNLKDFAIPIDVSFKNESGDEEVLSLWKWYLLDDKTMNEKVKQILDKLQQTIPSQQETTQQKEEQPQQQIISQKQQTQQEKSQQHIQQPTSQSIQSETNNQLTQLQQPTQSVQQSVQTQPTQQVASQQSFQQQSTQSEIKQQSQMTPQLQKSQQKYHKQTNTNIKSQTQQELKQKSQQQTQHQKQHLQSQQFYNKKQQETQQESKTKKSFLDKLKSFTKEKPQQQKQEEKPKKEKSQKKQNVVLETIPIKDQLENLKQQSDFLKQTINFFENNNIEVLEFDIIRKNTESNFVVRIPSIIGKIRYFVKSKNKKKLNDKDISAIYLEGQSKKLPILILSTGELTKKAQEVIEKDLKIITIKSL